MKTRRRRRKKNRVHETMTRAWVGLRTVRVWTSAKGFEYGPNPAVLNALTPLHDNTPPHVIAKVLDELPDVSAFEILDESGHGGVVYPDWR